MSKHMPPVPPAGRNDKGPGDAWESAKDDQAASNRTAPSNLAEQDRQGDIKQNTRNQGHQQDR